MSNPIPWMHANSTILEKDKMKRAAKEVKVLVSLSKVKCQNSMDVSKGRKTGGSWVRGMINMNTEGELSIPTRVLSKRKIKYQGRKTD